MTEKKILKKSTKAVWQRLKALRADRAKLYSPSEINASADQLNQLADELRDLARKLSALNAMPPDAIPPASSKTPRARKRKNAT